MAKQIIILEVAKGPGGDRIVNACFWFAVPVGQETPQASASSAFRSASLAEIQAIQAGQIIEQMFSTQVPIGANQTQIKAALVAEYTSRKAVFDGRLNPNQFYGTFYDGSVWQ